MFEMTAGVLGLGLAMQAIGWTVVSVLYPIFVVWMIVDALTRNASKPGGLSSNDRLLWVLFMLLANPAAFVYFLVVYRPATRSVTGSGAGALRSA